MIYFSQVSGKAIENLFLYKKLLNQYVAFSYIDSFMMEIPIIWNQSFDLIRKLMEWFLYNRNLRHERVKTQKNDAIYCHLSIFIDNLEHIHHINQALW